MIIVEGIDNTGKSTVIEVIGKTFKIPAARSNMAGATVKDMKQWIAWAESCPRPLILDRHPAISDFVYGNVIRGKSESSIEFAQESRAGHFLIYCCPTLESIQESFGDREQMKGTHENLEKLYTSYESLMEQLEPDFYYDWRNPQSQRALLNYLARPIFAMFK